MLSFGSFFNICSEFAYLRIIQLYRFQRISIPLPQRDIVKGKYEPKLELPEGQGVQTKKKNPLRKGKNLTVLMTAGPLLKMRQNYARMK